jgi:hypothetical protein
MNKPITDVITLVDDSGIEMLVNFTKQYEDQKEDFHGEHDMSGWSYILNRAELVIAGEGIDITKQLSLKQYHAILDEVRELDQETA